MVIFIIRIMIQATSLSSLVAQSAIFFFITLISSILMGLVLIG
jgi:hypothetical protein